MNGLGTYASLLLAPLLNNFFDRYLLLPIMSLLIAIKGHWNLNSL